MALQTPVHPGVVEIQPVEKQRVAHAPGMTSDEFSIAEQLGVWKAHVVSTEQKGAWTIEHTVIVTDVNGQKERRVIVDHLES